MIPLYLRKWVGSTKFKQVRNVSHPQTLVRNKTGAYGAMRLIPQYCMFDLCIPGAKFCQRATKQPISHRGPLGAQTGPGTLGRQLITIIMNYNQPWATLGLAPQPQRENRDPNGSQGSANFHCIMVPGSPWSALRSLLRLQSAILTSFSGARDFVGGPKHRGSVSGSKTWTQLSRRVHQVMHLFTPGGANRARRDGRTESGDAK